MLVQCREHGRNGKGLAYCRIKVVSRRHEAEEAAARIRLLRLLAFISIRGNGIVGMLVSRAVIMRMYNAKCVALGVHMRQAIIVGETVGRDRAVRKCQGYRRCDHANGVNCG
jgi:hypothetical protein